MVRTIIQMLISSKNKPYYLLLILPIIILNVVLYHNVLNFTILLLVNYVATFSSLILSFELLKQEEGSDIFAYLKVLKGENALLMYRTRAIFLVSSIFTIITSMVINGIYLKDIYVMQQAVYLALILLGNYFYTYFLQYLFANVCNLLFRNSIIIAVSALSMLSLMTRSVATYSMYVTIIGLFLAVTYMNRRLTDELKRESKEDKY